MASTKHVNNKVTTQKLSIHGGIQDVREANMNKKLADHRKGVPVKSEPKKFSSKTGATSRNY